MTEIESGTIDGLRPGDRWLQALLGDGAERGGEEAAL